MGGRRSGCSRCDWRRRRRRRARGGCATARTID